MTAHARRGHRVGARDGAATSRCGCRAPAGARGRVEGVDDGETFQLQVAGCFSDGTGGGAAVATRCRSTAGRFRVDGLPACTVIAYARIAKRMQPVQGRGVRGSTASFDLDLAPPRLKTVRASRWSTITTRRSRARR